MMSLAARVAVLVLLPWLTPVAGACAQELTLSVAISMRDVVDELGRGFMAARPGVTLRYNLGSSGELQKQIEAGAPVDLFISAAQRQMDELERKGLVVATTRRVFARNVLTVVKPADSTIDLAGPVQLLDGRIHRIVIGNPRTVPWITWPGARWTPASCTRPTPPAGVGRCPRRSGRPRTPIRRCSIRPPW
jgi:molybdate transport system substrate-binding protein